MKLHRLAKRQLGIASQRDGSAVENWGRGYLRQLAAPSFPVSNTTMKLLRLSKRVAVVALVISIILVAGVSAYLRIEQYRFRVQAERLLSDLRDLELGNASGSQADSVIKKWGFAAAHAPHLTCTENECTYYLELVPKLTRVFFFENRFRRGVVAGALAWLGFRPSSVQAWIKVRAKMPPSVSLTVYTLGRNCDEPYIPGCMLVGFLDVRQRIRSFTWSSRDAAEVKLKQSLLHPAYLVGRFTTLFNADTGGDPAAVIWVELSPEASMADVSRLMQLDLSCLTRLRPCKVRDLMPVVWAQSAQDIRELPSNLTCTAELSKHVAHIADVIATVRPKTVELTSPLYDGRPRRLTDLEIVGLIKKPMYPHRLDRSQVEVDVEYPQMLMTADSRARILPGHEYVFFLQLRNDSNISWIALYPCGILTANDANLAMVHRAAGSEGN